jgi:hypothetical protein
MRRGGERLAPHVSTCLGARGHPLHISVSLIITKAHASLVLGAFSTGVFNTNALPRINIGADVWGESSIMIGIY